jgi:hypothetical protein
MADNKWVPESVAPVSGGKYFNLKELDSCEGKTDEVRILLPLITGVEAWDENKKPHRFASMEDLAASGLKIREEPGRKSVKPFWATAVWHPRSKSIRVWSFTQSTVRNAIAALAENKKLGTLDQYDLSITKSGSGMDTEYSIVRCDREPLAPEAQTAWDELRERWVGPDALFHGGDPFADWSAK